MKIKVMGCGNAFSRALGNASFLLEEGNRKLLIDCGSRVPLSLYKMGININDIKFKMHLTHYQDFLINDKDFFCNDVDWDKMAENDGFSGFLKPSQEFTI